MSSLPAALPNSAGPAGTGPASPGSAMVASADVAVVDVLRRLATEGAELEANNRARSTRRAYAGDFAHFAQWCATVGTAALPASAEAVYLYLTALVADANAAEYSASTLERRLAAITYVHEVNGHGPSPARHVKVRELMAGIRRTYPKARVKRDPLTTAQLAAMVAALDVGTVAGTRDRAVLLVGYAGAFRRAELASLTLTQLERHGDGYVVALGRTKADQDARGRTVGIPNFAASPLCPVAALDTWLSAAQIHEGPVFRRVTRYGTIGNAALSSASVALIVKRCAMAAGIPASRLSGHSLRAGHATTAAANGAPNRVIMRQTGHRSVQTLEACIRSGRLAESSGRYLDLETP